MSKKIYILAIICVLTIVAVSCIQKSKSLKVIYKGNIPEGVFKATINGQIIFTNGHDIIEVYKESPDFFCYEVGEEYFCRTSIKIKISDSASQRLVEITKNLDVVMVNDTSNRLILSKKLIFHLYDKEIDFVEIDNTLQGELISQLEIPLVGIGKTKNEAIKNGMKKADELFNILMDVKR